jgi:hypothetical protein
MESAVARHEHINAARTTRGDFLHSVYGLCLSSPQPISLLKKCQITDYHRATIDLCCTEIPEKEDLFKPGAAIPSNEIIFQSDGRAWGRFVPPDRFIVSRTVIDDIGIQANFCKLGLSIAAILLGGVTIHASAVAIEGRAIAFMAHSGFGKTTLLQEMLRQGCEFLTDDILIVWPGCKVHAGPLFINRCARPEARVKQKQIVRIARAAEGECDLSDVVWLDGFGDYRLTAGSVAQFIERFLSTIPLLRAGTERYVQRHRIPGFADRRKSLMAVILDTASHTRYWQWRLPQGRNDLQANAARLLKDLQAL